MLGTFQLRFRYLNLKGVVGQVTFGFDRWVNQEFYTSSLWKDARRHVILRDRGCDLGIDGREIHRDILVHHMNPMTPEDIKSGAEWIIDPEYLITTTKATHNAIHFGDESLLPKPMAERRRGDTKLW